MIKLKGSATIELAYIMPLIFLMFIAIIYISFYLHDKNVLKGAACETAVILAQGKRNQKNTDVQASEILAERLAGKLIFLDELSVESTKKDQQIIIKVNAGKKRIRIMVEEKALLTWPEKHIRDMRSVEKGIQDLK